MTQLLDNIAWHTLAGAHAQHAAGTETARRYLAGFPPIAGFADGQRPDFDALANFCEPGEHLYCDGWSGAAPPRWQIEAEASLLRMTWEGAMPPIDEAPEAVRLGPQHASLALELAELTHPGPFGPRALELGECFGFFDGPRLVAMAGERMQAGALREISGVCTHPGFQGRGLARRLVLKLVRRQMQRKQKPFLHVMHHNNAAHRLYERMGFRLFKDSVARIVSLR